MKRYGLGWIAWGAFLFQDGFAVAQNSLETLEQELNDAKQQHEDVTSHELSNFFTQLDPAMSNADAAVDLYQKAGGDVPDPTPVMTVHESESATEKDARLALDQANLSRFTAALQLHCGLMHYAALFVVKPDQKGLQDDWVAWLKSAAQIYPQLGMPAVPSPPKPEPKKKKTDRDDRDDRDKEREKESPPVVVRPPPFNPAELKGKAMRDSLISKFLDFQAWGDKEQGGWSVLNLPGFYRATVLEPLRASPTAATLAAWDVYIGMVNADETDNDRWNQVVYPPLEFDRACDDCTVAPSTEKLEKLVNIIRANPTYPHVDDWIAHAHQMMEDYRMRREGKTTTASNSEVTSSSSDPNVTVTTVHQGDMTIITTHTNSAPITNAPPVP